ncbi:MAG: hypothetical protein WCO56_28010 [Verrucomicrobiota bacterium]
MNTIRLLLLCLPLAVALGAQPNFQQAVVSTNFGNIVIKPVTQRPCLLMEAADIPEIRRRWESIPNRPDTKRMGSTLCGLIYGDETAKRKATVDFMKAVRTHLSGDVVAQFGPKTPYSSLRRCRRLKELLCEYDIIASFGTLTKEEEKEFREDTVRAAKFIIGDDPAKFPSPKTPSTNGLEFPTGFSTCNRWPDQYIGAALVGLNFPDEPLAKAWVKYAAEQTEYALDHGNWDGTWNEVPRYHDCTLRIFSGLFPVMQRRTGVDFYQNPNVKPLLDWYVRFSSPLVRFPGTMKHNLKGEPTAPVWGDSNYNSEYFSTPILYAPHYTMTDPAFAKRLMWMWRRAGSQPGSDLLSFPMLADPSLPDAPQILGSELSKKLGLVLLRSGFDTPDETMVFMRGGSQGVTHKRSDLASIDFFSQGIPLALGSQSGPYGTDPAMEWNRSQISNNDVVFGRKSRERGDCNGKIDAFFTSPQVDYAVADCSKPEGRYVKPADSFHWRRHLLLVKNPDYLVVWDEISSPMISDWYLHTTASKFIWGEHLINSHTDYNADLDIHVLAPSGPLVPNEQEGIFGIKDKQEAPYPFKTLKYFSIPAQPNEDFLTVLHPRKPDGAPLTATLVSSSKERVSLKVTHGTSTEQISLGKDGASFHRDITPRITIPMAIQPSNK